MKVNILAHTHNYYGLHIAMGEISIQLQSDTGRSSHINSILASINESLQTDLLSTV